jgi:hypothetical protein
MKALIPSTKRSQIACASRAQVDEGVDPLDEARADRPRVGRVGRPFGGHVAAIEKQPVGVILRQKAGAEIGGEQAEAALAPDVHAPQPVARRDKALREPQVRLALRADMRHAMGVDDHLDRRAQPRRRDPFRPHGLASPSLRPHARRENDAAQAPAAHGGPSRKRGADLSPREPQARGPGSWRPRPTKTRPRRVPGQAARREAGLSPKAAGV